MFTFLEASSIDIPTGYIVIGVIVLVLVLLAVSCIRVVPQAHA